MVEIIGNICGMNCKNDFCIKRLPVFEKFEATQISKMSRLIHRRELDENTILYEEGEELPFLMIIRYGKIKLVSFKSDGQETLLETIGVGDFYGMDSLLEQDTVKETSIAMEPTGVCCIDFIELKKFLKDEPEIAIRILGYYYTYASKQRELLKVLSAKNTLQRIAIFLLIRYEKMGMDILNISQVEIAKFINSTNETVNRKLAELRKLNLIEISGYQKIKLLDIPALKML